MIELIEEEMLCEGIYQDVMDKIKERGRASKVELLSFLTKLKKQLGGTREGAQLLYKVAKGKRLTSQEAKALRVHVLDLAKGLPLLALFILPAGGIATVALVKVAKRLGFNLMPTAFSEA